MLFRGRLHIVALAWLLALLSFGCGGSGGSDDSANGGDAEPSGPNPPVLADEDPKHYPLEDLTEHLSPDQQIGPIPKGDGVVVTYPKDWSKAQSASGLAAFYLNRPNAMPRIFVRVEEPPKELLPEDLATTTADNVKDVARFLDEKYREDLRGRAYVEAARPMKLGDSYWVRHVRAKRYGAQSLRAQMLQRTRGGKVFTVELQVYKGDLLDEDRSDIDTAYAVAAALKFPGGAKKDKKSGGG